MSKNVFINNNLTIKERIILKLKENRNKLFKKNQIFYSLRLQQEQRQDFEESFEFLLKNKIIISNKHRKIKFNMDSNAFIGKIYFSPNGFGFVNPIGENSKNYFVSKENTLNSLHEDIVIAVKTKDKSSDKKRPEAKVLIVLSRTITNIVGTFMASDDFGFVIPDDNKFNSDIYIPKGLENGAKSYDKVVVKIEKYPKSKKRNPEGVIEEVLGLKGDKEAESLSIVKSNELRDKFPPEVIKEANCIKTLLDESDLKNREDFRDETIFTIDGIDARDLDDAISIKKDGDFYDLGVHIADVSHYVKENSEIDKEALLRGTSVYLLDKVIPMLPKVLSNNVCSLNENEDKLVLSVLMRIDKYGRVVKSRICEGVVSSKGRLNYDEVTSFLEGQNEELNMNKPEIANSLMVAKELATILMKRRYDRGSIEFGFDETKIVLDESGKPIKVEPYKRGISNDIIEEFMLITNETIAKKFCEFNLPFIYRVHTYPRVERLETFKQIVTAYGYDFNFNDLSTITPKELQEFLNSLQDDKTKEALKMQLLQSMQQARYNCERSIHYGLATEYYCHFTSPIRRYPDLQIHRIVKESLHSNLNPIAQERLSRTVENVSKHCSIAERKAERAECELDKIKMSEYIMDRKNEVFEGFIKNFNKVGIFIVLNNTIDGFIKLQDFEFDQHSYTGKINNIDKVLRLGDRLKVKPKHLSLNTKEIIFEIVELI